MKRSVNEIQGLVLKAARGAGVPLGIAEDLSASVPFTLADDTLADIADILEQGEFAPLIDDIAALDARECGQQTPRPPATTPRLMEALAAARGLADRPRPANAARPVADALWARLEMLAARTYVPATEASRASGAGAGLSDND